MELQINTSLVQKQGWAASQPRHTHTHTHIHGQGQDKAVRHTTAATPCRPPRACPPPAPEACSGISPRLASLLQSSSDHPRPTGPAEHEGDMCRHVGSGPDSAQVGITMSSTTCQVEDGENAKRRALAYRGEQQHSQSVYCGTTTEVRSLAAAERAHWAVRVPCMQAHLPRG